MNIFIIGPMGAGKSTVGKVLAQELGLKFYDSDDYLESKMGASIAWIFDLEGEDGFREREEAVIDELTQKKDCVIATGGGVVISAQNRKNLTARGISVYLKTNLKTQEERTRFTDNRPLLNTNEDSKQVLARLNKERDPYFLEVADYVVDASSHSSKQVVKQILAQIQA